MELSKFELVTLLSCLWLVLDVVRLRLILGFIAADECQSLFDELFDTLPWQQETVVDGDETYLQPRLTAWIGEHPYSYTGITHSPNTEVNGSMVVTLGQYKFCGIL